MPELEGFRAGFCGIVGLPNVGKSTLLNELVGERLSGVTPKAQTTRKQLLGLYSDEEHQVVFVDTPGLLDPRYPLQAGMREEAERAIRDSDVLLFVVDCGFGPSVESARDFEAGAEVPGVLVLNKADRVDGERLEALRRELTEAPWDAVIPTVATEGRGVDRVLQAVLDRLPESPPFYPLDQLSTATMRELVAERVQETCFEELEEEVPYGTAVEVVEYREDDDPLYIAAVLYVERDSQKGIVIGRSGRMIKRIGRRSRPKVEELVGRKVYLDLRVKVLEKWRKKPGALARLGLPRPKRKEDGA